jgi:two-component sensor histidine kinase
VLAPHTFAGALGWTLVAVVVPTVLRLVLDAGRYGTPFVTFYPALVLSALFLGWRYSVLTLILCSAVARLLFMQDVRPLASSPEGLAIFGLFLFSCASLMAIGEAFRQMLAAAQAASARETLLNQELRHRLRNVLAVVNSLSTLSHRHSDPEQAQNAFAERLAALDRATSLLGGDSVVSCALPELTEEALRPFLNDYDIRLSGEAQAIDRDACVPAVLALHELATNAIKYGALGAANGWVELSWREPEGGMVSLRWSEHDGPQVKPPLRRGMGSRILSMHSPAAKFSVDFAAGGVRCDMELKAASADAP